MRDRWQRQQQQHERDDREEDDYYNSVLLTPRPMSHLASTTTQLARQPSSRRRSFTGLGMHHGAATATASAAQGSYVASFAMARAEQAAYLDLAKSQLPHLIAECAREHSGNDVGLSAGDTATNKWTRIKAKKKSTVPVWEKETNGSAFREFSTSAINAPDTPTDSDPWAHVPTSTSGRGRRTHDLFSDSMLNSSSPACVPSSVATYAVRSSVTVNAPLAIVMRTLDCSAVTAYRSFTKIIYENLVAETSVLYHSQSSANPGNATTATTSASLCTPSESLAVRWLTCRCNNPMVSDCDFCLLEYTKVHSIDDLPKNGAFELRGNNTSSSSSSSSSNQESHHDSTTPRRQHALGRSQEGLHDRKEFPSAYKILCSIETKSCPELLESHRIARCYVPLGGYLFYPTTNSDVTDVVFYMSIAHDRSVSGTSSSNQSSSNLFSGANSSDRQFRAVQKVLQHLARGVGRIKNAVDAYSMSLRLEVLRDNTRWVRNMDRAQCVVCYRRFHQLTRRRHHCRMCGDVICRDCSVYKDADLPNVGPTLVRICKLCELNELKHTGDASLATNAASAEGSTGGDDGTAPRTLTRKRSSTINVDTSKAVVHDAHQQREPEVGRRFTTVVDGEQRRELPDQAFSCSKAEIMDRKHKWNTGGGGKPRVVFSPSSATSRPGKAGFGGKAMTPTAKNSIPPVWDLGAATTAATTGASSSQQQQSKPPPHRQQQKHVPHAQANSCSKAESKSDRFTYAFRKQDARDAATGEQENNREGKAKGIDEEEKGATPAMRMAASPGAASRAIKEGKLITPKHDFVSSSSRDRAASIRRNKSKKLSNQRQEKAAPADTKKGGDGKTQKLVPRKLPNVQQYEDILFTLCEQISTLLNCKYAAVSIYTAVSSSTLPTNEAKPVPAVSSPSHESHTTVHFLKAEGSKKLSKVSANLMCCAPMMELKDKIITRDTLSGCNLFDFDQLPIVMGPQQVRFYAGIPLVDATTNQMIGAFAVFDANVYRGSDINEVLPTLEAFASVALDAIEDRKTNLELKSFLKNPLVDPTAKKDNQSLRLSEPVFHIDMHMTDGADGSIVVEYDRDDDDDGRFHTTGHHALQVRPRFSSRPQPTKKKNPQHDTLEFYKNQMAKLVRQARQTEAQVLENSIAMKRHGVVI